MCNIACIRRFSGAVGDPSRIAVRASGLRAEQVCFSRIHPGESAGTAVKPLVDSGLMAPEGIAVDRKRGAPRRAV